MRRFDVVVAGGGSAGCALAARLSENVDRTVCLIEAGPDYGPYEGGGWPDDLLDGRMLAFSHAWETDREDRSQLRARVLGGCSAHNACAVIAGTAGDYDEWGDGWTHAELEPYLRRAAEQLRARSRSRRTSCRRGTAPSPRRPARARSPIPRTASARCAGTARSPTSTRPGRGRT